MKTGTDSRALKSSGPVQVLNEENIAPALLAKAICDVADAAKTILGGPLKRRAIVVLLQDSIGPGITKKQIEQVLDAAADLKRSYVVA